MGEAAPDAQGCVCVVDYTYIPAKRPCDWHRLMERRIQTPHTQNRAGLLLPVGF